MYYLTTNYCYAHHEQWFEIGVKRNTSAQTPILFTVNTAIPWASVKALRLLEASKLIDTQLEQIMIYDKSPSSSQYSYQIKTGFPPQCGPKMAI